MHESSELVSLQCHNLGCLFKYNLEKKRAM